MINSEQGIYSMCISSNNVTNDHEYKLSVTCHLIYTGWPKNGTVDFHDFALHDQQLSFFTLLDRASFPHYNNTKIIKFG